MLTKLFDLFRRKNIQTIESHKIEANIPELDIIDEMELDLIIGQKIIDIQYRYVLLGWLDYFQTFLTLENGKTINLPMNNCNRTTVINLPLNSIKFKKEFSKKIIGNKITNFHSNSDENIVIDDYSSIIELENKHYIYELNMSPHGTGHADLFIISESKFIEKTKEVTIVSYSKK